MNELDRIASALAPLYRIQGETRRGALGVTYAAADGEGAHVAVTVLSRDLVAMMGDRSEQFIEGVQRAGRVRHEGLLPIAGAGITPQGDVYCASAYPDGETARERLERDGMLRAEEVATAGAALADALAAAHDGAVVHGAITPDEIHFTAAGPRLGGLGVHGALLAAGLDPRRLNAMLGAPQYTSPEQLGGAPVDARSDIYALGASLYELLTGKPPFGGRTTSVVMASVLADEPAEMTVTGSQAPGHVVNAILRAIEKAPEDRWWSAATFAQALREPGTSRDTAAKVEEKKEGAGCAMVVLGVLGVGILLLERLIA